jgi:predicted nucleotidyltransferase
MIDEIDLQREELRTLCRCLHVRRLDLFASAARGDFDPEQSDVDFLVEFDREHPEALSFNTYFNFKQALETLLGRSIGLIRPSACATRISRRRRGSRSVKRDPKRLAEQCCSGGSACAITPLAFHAPRSQ